MAISFCDMDFKYLLRNQATYARLNDAGKRLFPDWDMERFEKYLYGLGEYRYLENVQTSVLKSSVKVLDEAMPYLFYGEEGQHYGYELFMINPNFRKDFNPLFWAYMARKFTFEKLPMDEEYLIERYIQGCLELGIKFHSYGETVVKSFSAGYHGTDIISGRLVHDVLYTIKRRNKAFLLQNVPSECKNLNNVYDRIDSYCNRYRKGQWKINRNTPFESILFIIKSDCTPRQAELVFYLWGVDDGVTKTFKEAAEHFNLTSNRIKSAEDTVVRRIISIKDFFDITDENNLYKKIFKKF